jgi:hypothetical protein
VNEDYCDRLDVIDVFNSYAAAIDERNWERLTKLYIPDAIAEQPEGSPPLIGREAIVAMISAAIDWLGPTQHLLSNHVAEVVGDRAEASCYVRGYKAGRGEHADKFVETLGRLSAKLVRTPGGWRFTSFVEHKTLQFGRTEIFNPALVRRAAEGRG